jgi:methylated-DNA-[protein]-cysteine S-methyltransferase
MNMIAVETQFGTLGIEEEAGEITSVVWDGVARGDETPVLQEAVSQMRAYDRGELEAFDLPLRVDGSALQQSVCAAMRDIPFG